MMRRFAVVASLVASVLAAAMPAAASDLAAGIISVEFVGEPDTRFSIDDRRYAGPVRFALHGDGLAFTEYATVEQYLQGIAEMPFAWPGEALAAQAVAARTYLTRRLAGGRAGDAARYGFDICATNRCQVYRGVDLVEGRYGDRWREAVEATTDELVVYAGRPVEAVYTSMVGSRSRANQDVWPSDPVPYLQPVDSPEVGVAPYAQWSFSVTAHQFLAILTAADLDVGGELIDVIVDDPPEGAGRTELTIVSTEGTDSILAPALKGVFNRHGDDLFPTVLPGASSVGRDLPEPLPSYTYDIEQAVLAPRPIDAMRPGSDALDPYVVRFSGEGWGHGVGMSQWGARVMATKGASHVDILTHYYTGTEAVEAPELVPDAVVVGLDWARHEISVGVEGEAVIKVNGIPVGSIGAGEWSLRSSRTGVVIVPADPASPFADLGDRPWPR